MGGIRTGEATTTGVWAAVAAALLLVTGCASATMDLPPTSPGSPGAPAAPVLRPSNVLEQDPEPPSAEGGTPAANEHAHEPATGTEGEPAHDHEAAPEPAPAPEPEPEPEHHHHHPEGG